jgi:tetratricopeptide (TPR) repeat protein
MASSEWYRRRTWSVADRTDFEARLKRSRTSYRRAQYLRLQAFHLQEVGTPEFHIAALDLLERVVTEYSSETSQLAQAHEQRAQSLAVLRQHEEALKAYRAALDAERMYPNWQTEAYLGFAELIVALRRADRYDEGLAVLEAHRSGELFPIQQFRSASARAAIYEARGERDLAGEAAVAALAVAVSTESPFRYHRKLGLVDPPPIEVKSWLERLARGG